MIHIYKTLNVSSGGKHLFVAVDTVTGRWSSPRSDILTLELKFSDVPTSLLNGAWHYIGQVPSLPVDLSLYPELLL